MTLPTRASIWSLTLLVLLPQEAAASQQSRVPAEPMSYVGAPWLERAERESEELPEAVLDALQLQPGDVVADLGAGSGYFARRLARRVMPGGTVYAVDIQPEMLEILARLGRAEGVGGIEPVLATATDPRLPAGALDWVVIADVYHEMAQPQPVLEQLRGSLAPAGRVALLEYRGEDGSGDHIKADHRMTARQVITEWMAAGFVLRDLLHFLPSQHMFVFAAAGEPLRDTDLVAALEAGAVAARARLVDGGVRLVLASRSDARLLVHAPAGTRFVSAGRRTELVSRRDLIADLPPGGEASIDVRAVARRWDVPLPSPREDLEVLPADRRLAAVMAAAQAGMYEAMPGDRLYVPQYPEIERAALWLTEPGASWEELKGHLASENVPAVWAAAFGLALADAAAIDVTSLPAWSRRGDIFSGLRDDGLSRWLQSASRR